VPYRCDLVSADRLHLAADRNFRHGFVVGDDDVAFVVVAQIDRSAKNHSQGFAIVDDELERGLRSIAVPIVDRGGQAVAALNVSTHSTRNEMRERFLPGLRSVAEWISASII
jgi:hypothetical protein